MDIRNILSGKRVIGLMPMPIIAFMFLISVKPVMGSTTIQIFDIITTLNSVQSILAQIGPTLSAVLFIIAGIFYALGQLFPTYKRATLHSASIDIIIGAIIVAVLSVASTGLAVASTHLLTNTTANTIANLTSNTV